MSQGIHLIFLGAPGAGKGTQAKLIAETYQAAHISTGDILREAVRNGTELGKTAKEYMNAGKLVPDDVIIGMMREKMASSDFPKNWILDGFPRTLAQAEAFAGLLQDLKLGLTAVLNIDVPLDLLMDRLTLRRTCRKTGKIFNLKFNPPDDSEQYDLYQRDDDKPEAVSQRLEVYTADTAPLIDFYRERDVLVDIKGDQSMETVTAEIKAAVDTRSK